MIKIICVGKIKENYLREALEEYKKRIKKYNKIEIIELRDYSFNNIQKTIETEKLEIEKFLNPKDYLITMEIDGKQISSEDFAKKLDEIFIGYSNITFIVGGSYGLHEDIKKKSNLSLSFSKMTFPHQLFRIILLEQIYRSFKILNKETYHK